MSTFGKVSVAKQAKWGSASAHGMAISPLLQSHYLRFCAQVVPATAVDLLNATLGSELTNAAQARRLEEHFGLLPRVEEELTKPLRPDELQTNPELEPATAAAEGAAAEGAAAAAQEERLYGMFDGGMLRYDEGYQEVKIGRVFRASQLVAGKPDDEQADQRNRVLNSEYLVREGHYASFVDHFGNLLTAQQQQYPTAPLIIITDGATWMRNWVAEAFPQAEHILDFYHAYEHLCEFGTVLLPQESKRKDKLTQWKNQFHQGQSDDIIREIKMYLTHPHTRVVGAATELLTYLTNNASRMRYNEYRDNGYLIGSGAIESAVSSVVQQRCKLKGQRWDQGAQPVLNIRSMYCSNKGRRMEEIIIDQYDIAA
ncbi:hypothetical protein [Neolewinella sp.]|uniref:hypothetical protein n=1 Tax=Neolewinella sp. TaxID=2993543 RepID=UPI003B522FAB